MSIIFADDPDQPPQLSAEDLAKLQTYVDRIASVGGSLLANASLLRKILDTLTAPDQDA